MNTKRLRGQRRDHIQIGGVAWRAAIYLTQFQYTDPSGWITTDDLAAEIDALPKMLPRDVSSLVEAGVVERRWRSDTVRGTGRMLEWRLNPQKA